jgi:hypothetical protein
VHKETDGNMSNLFSQAKWKTGTEFMLSVLVNDNDGRCRKVLPEWGGGIHGIAAYKQQNPIVLK